MKLSVGLTAAALVLFGCALRFLPSHICPRAGRRAQRPRTHLASCHRCLGLISKRAQPLAPTKPSLPLFCVVTNSVSGIPAQRPANSRRCWCVTTCGSNMRNLYSPQGAPSSFARRLCSREGRPWTIAGAGVTIAYHGHNDAGRAGPVEDIERAQVQELPVGFGVRIRGRPPCARGIDSAEWLRLMTVGDRTALCLEIGLPRGLR